MFAAPALPLLFMGEEYGETSPFQFFTSYLDPALVEAVRLGRAAEFSRFGWARRAPGSRQVRHLSSLAPESSLAGAPRHRELREYYRHWLTLRRTHPALGARGKERARCELDASGSVLTLTREAPDGMRVCLVANLTNTARPFAPPSSEWRDLLNSEDRASPAVGWAGRWPPTSRPLRSQPAGVIAS